MKKLPTLHIINGGASLPVFTAAKLPGQVLVWREILSEGPAVATVPEQEFWKMRQQYITSVYQETAAGYKQKVLDELPKLEAAGGMFEVVLWFDADLMCQINLLYLLFRLHQVKPAIVSLCTPEPYINIGLLQTEALSLLFDERQQLTTGHLEEASKLWQLYASPDPMPLQKYLQENQILLPQLQNALHLHLSRFPDCATGLGKPEMALLQLLKQEAYTTEELMQQFWQQYPQYGFGDWQIMHMLQRLQPDLIQQEQQELKLTRLGEKVLEGEATFTPKKQWLGGARIEPKYAWCYNEANQQLQINL